MDTWNSLSKVLNFWLYFPPEKEWQWEILSIMTDKTVDEIKERNHPMNDVKILTIGKSANGDVERYIIEHTSPDNSIWYSVDSESITDTKWLIDDLCSGLGKLEAENAALREVADVAEALTKKPQYGRSLIDQINNALLQTAELPLRTKLNQALKKAGCLE